MPFAAQRTNGSSGSAGVFELSVFATDPDRHGNVRAVSVAPEPAVFAVEFSDDLALGPGRATTLFVGHRVSSAVAVLVKVDASTFDQHAVFRGLSGVHHELPLGRVAGCQREGGFISPFFGCFGGGHFLRMGGTHEQAKHLIQRKRCLASTWSA